MINIHDDTWIYIDEFCNKELLKCTKHLECKGVDKKTTQYLRGQISILRNVLDLPNNKLIENIETEVY